MVRNEKTESNIVIRIFDRFTDESQTEGDQSKAFCGRPSMLLYWFGLTVIYSSIDCHWDDDGNKGRHITALSCWLYIIHILFVPALSIYPILLLHHFYMGVMLHTACCVCNTIFMSVYEWTRAGEAEGGVIRTHSQYMMKPELPFISRYENECRKMLCVICLRSCYLG